MKLLWLLAAPGCVLVTPRECAERQRDLWVRVVDPQGFPIELAQVSVANAGPRETNDAGEVLFRSIKGHGNVAVVASASETWTAGGAIVDPDRASVVTLVLARRDQAVLSHPEDGAAIVRDGVFSIVVPPGEDAEIPYRWVEPGEPIGPPKVGPRGALLDLRALVELPEVHPDGVLWRLEAPEDPDEVWSAWRFDPDEGWVSGPELASEGAYLTVGIDRSGWWGAGPEAASEQGEVVAVDTPIAGAEVRVWSSARPGAWVSASDREGRFDLPAEVDGRLHAEAWVQQGVDGARYTGAAAGEAVMEIALVERHDQDGDRAFTPDDCADRDPEVHPGAGDPALDCDGVDLPDRDHDGSPEGVDCDDRDPGRYPTAEERCDGVDEDCDGAKDDDVALAVPFGDAGACVPCTPDGVLALEPKLYWRLEAPDAYDDRVRDSSGFGRDGVEHGSPGRHPGVTIWPEDAPAFSGDEDTVSLDTDLFERHAHRISVAAWVRPQRYGRVLASVSTAESTAEADCRTSAPSAGTRALSVELDGSYVSVAVGDVGHRSDATLDLDRWSHVVATFDLALGKSKVYVGGRPSTVDFPPVKEGLPPDGRFVVGAALYDGSDGFEPDDPTRFDGLIDEVAVFDRVLSDEEVEALHDLARCTPDPCVLGSDPACAAADCDGILDGGAFAGTGGYWLLVNEREPDPEETGTCFSSDDGVVELFCGDGHAHLDPATQASELVAPWYPEAWPGGRTETCDDGRSPDDDACVGCALELRDATGALFRDCQALLDHDPSLPSGPYVLEDPAAPGRSGILRCRMEQGIGGTLVFFHDARSGIVFAPDRDADFLPDADDPAPDDPDPDGDGRLDGEEVQDGTDPLSADFGDVGPRFFTVRPPQGAEEHESFFGPTYSLLRWLATFRGPNGGFEFSMEWPCPDGESPEGIDWRQTSDPNLPGVVTGFEGIGSVPNRFKGLALRSDQGDAYLANPTAAPQFLVAAYANGLDPCSGWIQVVAEGDYCKAGTAPMVELWVRPW